MLKPDYVVLDYSIDFFMNEAAERGGCVALSTAGSGASLDQGAAVVTYAANSSGKYAVGVLVNDVVNYDLTRQHINFHKDEVQLGNKVTIVKKGWVTTDRISGTVTAMADAYMGPAGYFSNTNYQSNSPKVGRFLSTPDEDGFAKIEVNLPN